MNTYNTFINFALQTAKIIEFKFYFIFVNFVVFLIYFKFYQFLMANTSKLSI